MKKIPRLTLLFAMIIFILLTGSVYAANINCDLAITTSNNNYSKGEEFIANIELSNVSSEQGIIAFQATLDYDKDSLTLVEMTGQNSWDTPVDGASYNKNNGKLVLTRNQLTKANEVIFTIKFKINNNSSANPYITLKDISLANGNEGSKTISAISKNITVSGGTASSGNTNQSSSNNQGTTNNNNQDTMNNNQSNNDNNPNQNKPIYNDGNTKPDRKYDRTNITGKNSNSANTGDTTNDDTTSAESNDESKTNTETSTTTPVTSTDTNTSTIGTTTTVSNVKQDGSIQKAGISQFSLWLIIFTVAVVLITLFGYGSLMAIDKRNEYREYR